MLTFLIFLVCWLLIGFAASYACYCIDGKTDDMVFGDILKLSLLGPIAAVFVFIAWLDFINVFNVVVFKAKK